MSSFRPTRAPGRPPALLALVLAPCLLGWAGCAREAPPDQPRVEAEGAWARPMPAGANTAVYLELANEGGRNDRLLGGEADVARTVEIHESRMDGDVMRMERVDGVELSGGGRVALEPGGLHLMLLGLDRTLEPGDSIGLLLRFRSADSLRLSVPVRGPGGS